jgi:hypothetical protein
MVPHMLSDLILRNIESRGYETLVQRNGTFIEMSAAALPDGTPKYIARVEGYSREAVFLCAFELSALVGIDLGPYGDRGTSSQFIW